MRDNYNPDSINVASFKGMATAGGSFGASPEYLQSLTNAFVTRDGTLRPRPGSSALYAIASTATPELFQFSFAGQRWILHRFGSDFAIYRVVESGGSAYSIEQHSYKANVLRPASAGEPATYAVATNGNYCHIYVATASTQLVSIVLTTREFVVTSISATTATGRFNQWFTTSVTNSNTKLLFNNSFSNTTAIGNTGDTMTLTWVVRPVAIVGGTRLTTISCFWMRHCDASFYPGSSCYNTGLRRNSVPLDVNVLVPEELATNPIFNEPIQDLNWETYWLYDTNVNNATRLTKVTNRQPLVNNQWDFSDGSYRAINTQTTNRTPNYVAFGGLLSGNINSRIYINRLRTVLLAKFAYPSIADMLCFVDKAASANITWHTFNATVITSGEPQYFSFHSKAAQPPGVNQEAVVELLYTFNAAGAGASTTVVVDISPDLDRHTIVDGAMAPLYGYNLLANTKGFSFPNVVRVVGNRLILSGTSNQLLASSSDWNYRGLPLNNCQVSALNFGDNSPYLVSIDQTSATVRTIESVNGVLLVSTDSGVFRVSGRERNAPPNASQAVVAKLTSQTFATNCLQVINNNVYLANENGLYEVKYSREADEGVLEELSLPISGLFAAAPLQMTYSDNLDSILIKRTSRRKLLTYNLLSRTWSYTHVAVPYETVLFPTLDGYVFSASGTQVVASFDKQQAVDLAEIGFLGAFTIAALTQSVNTTPTATLDLVSPVELLQPYAASGVVLPAYDNQARAVGSASVVTETASGNVPKPILSSAVTKALYTDKAQRGMRLRDAFVFLKRTGTARVVVVPVSSAYKDSANPGHTIALSSDGTYTIAGAKTKQSPAYPSGDTVVVQLSDLGMSEAYAVGFEFTNEVVGFQLNTSAKTLGKLQ